VLFAVVYGVFIAFIPFYHKSQRKPSGAYLAFVLAFVLEMFGMPMSMYVLAWVFGHRLPDGILRGHTLRIDGQSRRSPIELGSSLDLYCASPPFCTRPSMVT